MKRCSIVVFILSLISCLMAVIFMPLNAEYSISYDAEYSISYDLDGGTFETAYFEKYTTQDVIDIAVPSKKGYEFVGWTGSNGDTPQKSVRIFSTTGNKKYTANWELITYSITYNLSGGFHSQPNPTSYNVISKIILNSPTKSGYEFLGWTGSNGSTPEKLVTISSGSTGDKTYTANWREITKLIISEGTTYIDNQYKGWDKLVSVTIPNSVSSIWRDAFSDCSSLTSVVIPDSVTSIGEYAFNGCSNLTNVYYTGTIEDWCNITFSNYSSNPMSYASQFYIKNSNGEYEELTEIEISNTITKINDYIFCGFDYVTKLTISNSVTSIGRYAFRDCSSLTSITIPDSVTSIGSYAFSYCTNLTNITIPNNVTSIERSLFEYCSGLTSVTIPDSVTSIREYAFSDCSKLTGITIPNSVTSIGYDAFSGCSSLTSVTIPDDVTSIGDYVFRDCSSLTSVIIGNSVTRIGAMAFYDCSSLEKVYYKGTLTDWNNISIGNYNSYLSSATRYYYSETQPTVSGNYWHYDTDGATILEW